MADISKITVEGVTYDIKDAVARSQSVTSVNGQTGTVTLDADDVGALPDNYVAPVTSVNGMTGDVVVGGGGAVDSVNGQTGTVVLTASDVSAIPTSDKQSYNSASSLNWNSLSATQKAMVPTIQGIAFWNGAYDGTSSNLKYSANGEICGKSGFTMTGQILTSFNQSVATGSYQPTATTVDGLVAEVRFSSGCMGSVNISTAYTKNDVTMATGWYNFLYVPHRSGGVNGSASGDNCNYGTLTMWGMNADSPIYTIRVSSGALQTLHATDWSVTGTSGDWKYKKWGDGTVEAWGTVTIGTYTGSQWVTNLYYQNTQVAVPSGIFSSTPSFANVTTIGELSGNGWTVWGVDIASAQTLNIRFCKPTGGSMSLKASIYLRS